MDSGYDGSVGELEDQGYYLSSDGLEIPYPVGLLPNVKLMSILLFVITQTLIRIYRYNFFMRFFFAYRFRFICQCFDSDFSVSVLCLFQHHVLMDELACVLMCLIRSYL